MRFDPKITREARAVNRRDKKIDFWPSLISIMPFYETPGRVFPRRFARPSMNNPFFPNSGPKSGPNGLAALLSGLWPFSKWTAAPKSRGKILVVDDDANIRELLQMFLASKGFEVTLAAEGMEAVSALKRERPHLVLLDIMMPRMSGFEVLKMLKAADPKVAVIMITALGDMSSAQECLALGAYDYIVKPLNLDYLETSVMAKIMLMTA